MRLWPTVQLIMFATLAAIPISGTGLYLHELTTERYQVAVEVIRTDPQVESVLGEIRSYRLAYLGGFRVERRRDTSRCDYRIVVDGALNRGEVRLTLIRRRAQWQMQEGTIHLESGESVALKGGGGQSP